MADLPFTLAQAYHVGSLGMQDIAAWKVGGANPWSQAVFGNDEAFIGPLSAREVVAEGHQVSVRHLHAPLAEPEVILRLGVDGYDAMAIGVEIPATVLPEELKPNLIAQVCDRAGAGALWIGPAWPFDSGWIEAGITVEWRRSEGPEVEGHSGNILGGVLGAAAATRAIASRYGLPLGVGQWIATGGLLRAGAISPGDILDIRLADQTLQLEIVR